MYGKALAITNFNDLPLDWIKQLCMNLLIPSINTAMGNFPLCNRVLVQHIRRVNHQVGIRKRTYIPLPSIPMACLGQVRKVDKVKVGVSQCY